VARKFDWHISEFRRIRKSEGIVELLTKMGAEVVASLNPELHAAQAKRGQPVEDGYGFRVSLDGTRARLHILPYTARAQAHEEAHTSILKHLKVENG
jgi:hypothetical protein